MPKPKKHICVIGAGSSGLVAIKELLDEGHAVTAFEKYAQPGGAFYRSDDADKAGAYDSVQLTISNYMMAFSSYPPKEGARRFWTGREYQQYLLDFARHFRLNEAIRYGMEVSRVVKTVDGRYEVTARSSADGTEAPPLLFDAVAVCTGSSRVPNWPALPGLKDFGGEVHHSAFYRNASPYAGRNVLCIGMGETGVDVVTELAGVAHACTLSIRQRQPTVERFPLFRDHPSDAYTAQLLYAMPVRAGNARMRLQFLLMRAFGKEQRTRTFAEWNLQAGTYFNYFNIKSDVFVDRLVDGRLAVNTSGIDYIGPNFVRFKDGVSKSIDTIMLNTGYTDSFSFLGDVEIKDVRRLYKHMIHPDLGAGIVFIGWARPAVGGVPACSEMQSRYFALLCSEKKKLPDRATLLQLITKQANYEDEVYFRNPNVRSLVHYSGYMNDFAKVIGCSPWRLSTLLNPRLAYRLWVGSQMPYMYRLDGPHSNRKQAEDAIFKVPIAFNALEVGILSAYTLVTRTLARLHIMTADPEY